MIGLYTQVQGKEEEKNIHIQTVKAAPRTSLWVQPQPPKVLPSNVYPKILAWDLWKTLEWICAKELHGDEIFNHWNKFHSTVTL